MTDSTIASRLKEARAQDAQTPDELRASEERYRLLAETIPAITWTADPAGAIQYINDRWTRYTGLASRPAAAPWPVDPLHPDDRERVAESWRKSVATGSEHRLECRLRRHDGMYRWFEVHGVALKDANGRVSQWFGATTDIDERKRGEEIAAFLSRASAELAHLSDYRETLKRIAGLAIPAFADWCGIFLTAEDGTVERLALASADPERVRILQETRDRYPYRPTDPIGPGKVLATGESDWAETMADDALRRFAHDEQHLELLKQLEVRSWVCVPIRLERRIGGAISFCMTDSGRVYTEAHLRVAEDLAHRVSIAIENSELVAALRESDRRKGELVAALREQDQRKDEFLAMLAHELRNPLAPIRNAVQILRAKGPPAPELMYARDVIDRQAQHMSRLVDDLLDIARVGSGKIELRRDRVALSAAVNSAIEACRPLIEESRHHLAVSMPMEAIHVDGDLTRLSQVLGNLINNAVKYTEPAGRIWVSADRVGDMAVVRVRDTGIGIAHEMLTRIFEMFTQVDRSLDRSRGGLGVGLTLAKRLVEMHGGELVASSEGPGKGSEFSVRLPVAPGARAPAQPSPGASAAAATGAARMLIVDDNRDAADTLCMYMQAKGHDVRVAYDGVEGVEAAMAFKPQVVLLDIGLPRMYGYDVARAIREEFGASVLIIAVTGYGQEEDRRLSKAAGFDHHFTKPVDLLELDRLFARIGL